MFKVKIETIPYDEMSYPTPGDYYWSHDGTLVIQVAKLEDWRQELLVALHELVEVALCKERQISLKQIEDWDLKFESEKDSDDERGPGDVPGCPYRREHLTATAVEMLVGDALGVDWDQYEESISTLDWPAGKDHDQRGGRH